MAKRMKKSFSINGKVTCFINGNDETIAIVISNSMETDHFDYAIWNDD